MWFATLQPCLGRVSVVLDVRDASVMGVGPRLGDNLYKTYIYIHAHKYMYLYTEMMWTYLLSAFLTKRIAMIVNICAYVIYN